MNIVMRESWNAIGKYYVVIRYAEETIEDADNLGH